MAISKYKIKREWNPTNDHVFVFSRINNVFHREMVMHAVGAVVGDKKEKKSRDPNQKASSGDMNASSEIIAAISVTEDSLCVHARMGKQLAWPAGDLKCCHFLFVKKCPW